MNSDEFARRPFFLDVLHIVVLSGFAVAQPMFDLLGQNAEFFVAHHLGPLEIVGFAVTLSFAIPVVLFLIEMLALSWSLPAQQTIHLFFVFTLLAATIAPLLNKVSDLPIATALFLTFVCAALLAGLYARSGGFRSFITYLSPSVLAFPALFLFVSPVNSLLTTPMGDAAAGRTTVSKPTPIVLVIFDEFEAGSLLDANGQIDAVRFPNFAGFAKESMWFSNATAAWPETRRAVPAILTGMFPKDPKSIPSVQSHPDNLFTWLKGSYRLNVDETLTSLCPPDLCIRDDAERSLDHYLLFRDLSVVYLHIVLPSRLSKDLLPPMDTGWRGFGSAGGADHEDKTSAKAVDSKAASAYRDRADRFTSFVESVKGGNQNTLNFLHILLPHVSYTYLPSGATYLGRETEGLLERGIPDKVWVNDEYLPAVAYHRFLMQVGYVDTMLGRMNERLKAEGIYDRALIIITTDHGKSFRPGQPKRLLTRENAPDLLHIPLFIKLPGNSAGRRDERPVSSVDILPTIADVIGARLPWKSDGRSLLEPGFEGRDQLELLPLDSDRAIGRYDTRELTGSPRLEWKLATFGSGTPLATIGIKNRYSDLIGRKTTTLPIAEKAALRFESNEFSAFSNIRPGIIPAHLKGEFVGRGESSTDPLHIAITVNGTIEATVRTTAWEGKPRYLSALIPESALRMGKNIVELFEIEERDGISLSRIQVPRHEQFRLGQDDSGHEVLIPSDGKPIPIRPDATKGYLDRVSGSARQLTLAGWAVDTQQRSPATEVVVFVDAEQVHSAAPSVPRPDLVTYFKTESTLQSGFHFSLDRAAFNGSSIRVFAISGSGQASEIALSESQRSTLKP